MSKKIPTLGKGWLFLMAAFSIMGFVGNIMNIKENPIIYTFSAIACLASFIGVIFMLREKGLPFYIVYSIGYIANAVLSINFNHLPKTTWLVGFAIGILINLWLTHKSIEKTLVREEKPKTKKSLKN